jgi:hypothetical protein
LPTTQANCGVPSVGSWPRNCSSGMVSRQGFEPWTTRGGTQRPDHLAKLSDCPQDSGPAIGLHRPGLVTSVVTGGTTTAGYCIRAADGALAGILAVIERSWPMRRPSR